MPDVIWIVRHGQSAGNVARDAAEASASALIDIATRDMDTPLSPLGEQQSEALGDWFGAMDVSQRPTVIFVSPYVRARQTAVHIMRCAGWDPHSVALQSDERLREKEFGIVDRLTKFGIREKYPELDVQRSHVGKFYFRPPGGESWCDVILRLRSLLDTLRRDYAGERILIVAHQVTVNCFRYLLENLDEEQILAIDRQGDVPNCAVTSYQFTRAAHPRGSPQLQLVNFVAPMRAAGTPVTDAPDGPTQKAVGA